MVKKVGMRGCALIDLKLFEQKHGFAAFRRDNLDFQVITPFAEQIESIWTDEKTIRILDVLNKIGLTDWLTKNPFKRIDFQDQIVHQSIEVNGLYSFLDSTAQICVTRELSSFGQRFIWGKTKKLSETAENANQAVMYTLIHEVGHHVHNALKSSDAFQFGLTMRAVRTNAVSDYAKNLQAPVEYFAETFVAWVLYRAELLVYDPLGYAMLEKVLELLSLEVNEL